MNIQEWLQQERPLNVILHGDCMDLMMYLQWDEFDLAVVDPPYLDTFTTSGCIDNKAKKQDYKTVFLNNEKPTLEYFKELKRISKNQIIWGVNYYNNFNLSGGRIVWDKDNTGNYSDCELAYHSFSNVIRKFKYRWNGMLQENMRSKEIRIHPTQKPVALYRWILQNYAKPGQTIIDTHSGSGSLACACHLEGFDFIAIEKDYDYWKDSVDRLEQLKREEKFSLFDVKKKKVKIKDIKTNSIFDNKNST